MSTFYRDTARVNELAEAGHSESIIAASKHLNVDFVREVLERAERVRGRGDSYWQHAPA